MVLYRFKCDCGSEFESEHKPAQCACGLETSDWRGMRIPSETVSPKEVLLIDRTSEFHNTRWGQWNQTEGQRRQRLPDSHPDYREPVSKSSDVYHRAFGAETLNG